MESLKDFVERGNRFVVAHRGASIEAPENTLSAVDAAINSGAAMLEIDVQFTNDGEVVAWHDNDLNIKLNIDKKISKMNYDELRKIDAGSFFSEKYTGERILKLEEVLELIKDKMYLNIEIKEPKHDEVHFISKIIKTIEEFNYIDKTLFCSFYYNLLPNIKFECIDSHIAAIKIPNDNTPPSLLRDKIGIDAYICSIEEINETIANELKANSIFSGVYDLLDDSSIDKAIKYDVTAFASDDPTRISDYLRLKKII